MHGPARRIHDPTPRRLPLEEDPSAPVPIAPAGEVCGLSPQAAVRVADYLRAIGQVTRLRLIGHLGAGAGTATELAQRLGQSHANVTRHLQTLYSLGLADRERRRGTFVYSLRDRASLELVDQLAARISDPEAASPRDPVVPGARVDRVSRGQACSPCSSAPLTPASTALSRNNANASTD
jgi:DNA-binding transcriptional ArsR family regulator